MKLKKAIKIASNKGFNYVAVDKDGVVFAYAEKPVRCTYQWYTTNYDTFKGLGHYTGKKDWEETLRAVQ